MAITVNQKSIRLISFARKLPAGAPEGAIHPTNRAHSRADGPGRPLSA
jgi:hypothetical protein